MWFKKNWPALLAVALQAESLWKFLKWALDWRGRYDGLAATYHEIGGASAMIGYILDPPPWFYPLAFFVGLILMIWWNFHRNRKPIIVGDQANFRVIVDDHPLIGNPSDMPIGAPVSPAGCVTINEEWSAELIRWSQLYEEYDVDNIKELRLRFLPDTDDQESDALLLICYGYKVIRNTESILIRFVHDQIEYLLQHAPNTRQSQLSQAMMSLRRGFGDGCDFGQKPISAGDVERVGLSRGGEYRLTCSGENKADALARDLINRA